jgi:hypothetical protein
MVKNAGTQPRQTTAIAVCADAKQRRGLRLAATVRAAAVTQ